MIPNNLRFPILQNCHTLALFDHTNVDLTPTEEIAPVDKHFLAKCGEYGLTFQEDQHMLFRQDQKAGDIL
jgi:hypothetical protein